VIAPAIVTRGEADKLASGKRQPRLSSKLSDLARQLSIIVAVRERLRRFSLQSLIEPLGGLDTVAG
jgi:hypothetical protein